MGDPFARMHDRLLARLGNEAVLRGSVPCLVNVEKGVAVQGEYGEVVGHRTMAYIPSALSPISGDQLVLGATVNGTFIPATSYVLDGFVSDDGYLSRFWLR